MANLIVLGAQTTPVSAGSGLIIPTPRLHIVSTPENSQHYRNEPITGAGCINNGDVKIGIYWEGNDTKFLDYDPHYFLYRLKTKSRSGRQKNTQRNGRGYRHISNQSYGSPMFTNFSGLTEYASGAYRGGQQTEIPVSANPYALSINYIKPTWFFYNKITGTSGANDMFPISVTDFEQYVNATGDGGSGLSTGSRKTVKLKYCIVCRDPNNPNKPIFGAFSEELVIYPKCGWFDDFGTSKRYYYSWGYEVK